MATLENYTLGVDTRLQQFPDTPDNFVRLFSNHVKAIPEELELAGCTRVFLLVSKSLQSNTDFIQTIEAILTDKIVGKRAGIANHTPYTDIIELTKDLWRTSTDSIVVIGSSSYTDAAKLAMIAHATFDPSDRLEISDIESLALKPKTKPATVKSPTLTLFLTPTTLSAAEYSPSAGARNPETLQKQLFSHPKCAAKCVILDPELCTTTPMRLWLGTGIRAIDHCIEALCSEKCTPKIGSVVEQGLRNLLIGLLASHGDPHNVLAKGQSQIGAWQAMRAIHGKVQLGASHAIGHQLGGVANVAHGETSCVILPSVLKYNKTVNAELQKRVANILWESGSSIFEEAGLNQDTDTGDLLKAFVKALGLPTSLQEVGVGEDLYDDIATHTLSDAWAPTNPRPLRDIEQVKEILKMAA